MLQQHRLPRVLECRPRILRPHAHGGRRRPQFRLPQQVLAAPIPLLGASLGGERAAVKLQIQLARPHRRRRILGLRRFKEPPRAGQFDRRRSLKRRGTVGSGDHLLGRTAATVAPTERHERGIGHALLREQPLGPGQFQTGELRVVVGNGWKVREDAAAVEPLPEKAVVRKQIRVVPGQLLGEKPATAGGTHDLRKCRGVAERVGQPDFERFHPELAQKEPLAGYELPGQGLAAGHIRVGFNPHAAGWNEVAGRDGFTHALEQLRVELLEPGILLRRRGREHKVGVPVDQVEHVGPGACDLAHGLTYRPEPRAVDVRVANRVHPVRAGVGWAGEHRSQGGASGFRGAAHIVGVEQIEAAFQGAQNVRPPRRCGRKLAAQSVECEHVLGELPDLRVALGDIRLAKQVERCAAGGAKIAEQGGSEAEVGGDIRVGGGLDIEVNGVADHRHGAI